MTRANNKTIKRKGSNRKKEIMIAAGTLFTKNGYALTSMNDIATNLGMAKPSLYHYFKSKDEIFLNIFQTNSDEIIEKLKEILSSDKRGEDQMVEALKVYTRFVTPLHTRCTITINPIALPVNARSVLQRKLREIDMEFQAIYNKGIADGSFVDTSPRSAVALIIGAINNILHWKGAGGIKNIQNSIDIFTEIFLNGTKPVNNN